MFNSKLVISYVELARFKYIGTTIKKLHRYMPVKPKADQLSLKFHENNLTKGFNPDKITFSKISGNIKLGEMAERSKALPC